MVIIILRKFNDALFFYQAQERKKVLCTGLACSYEYNPETKIFKAGDAFTFQNVTEVINPEAV